MRMEFAMDILRLGLVISCLIGNAAVWGQSGRARQRSSQPLSNSRDRSSNQRFSKSQSVQNRQLNPTPRLAPAPPPSQPQVQQQLPVQQQMLQDNQAANMIRPLNFQLPPTNMFPQATPLAFNSPNEMSVSPMIPQISMIPANLQPQQPASFPFGPLSMNGVNPVAPQQRQFMQFMQPSFTGNGYGGQNNEFGDVPSSGATYSGFGDPYGGARDGEGDGLNSIYRSSFTDVNTMERNARYGGSSGGSSNGYAYPAMGNTYASPGYGGSYGSGQGNMNSVECLCTTDYIPVCGSDGITYINLCDFRCAKQQGRVVSSVTSRRGECAGTSTNNSIGVSWEVYNSPYYRPGDPCNWKCYKGTLTVCDQNGVVYVNACVFWKTNCRNGGTLTVTPCTTTASGAMVLDTDSTATATGGGIISAGGNFVGGSASAITVRGPSDSTVITISEPNSQKKFDFGGPFGEFPSAEKTSTTTAASAATTASDAFVFPSANGDAVVSLRQSDGTDPWSSSNKQVVIRQR
ncbi:hypothetical protein RvY_01049 [Ramazzottius varieornatus]|uniref:Kazal-like domain-containing protein n=1 Tax=Ramazzottius varieornatus TaxID=947166 RepID=A0A1D1UPP8_RAMVA|nr:hypothetical protein RvY_01049 [Ramazzottius varieornatus]